MSTDHPPSSDTKPPYDDQHLAKVASALRDDRHPTEIGPYRILETIGEGGMGTVYRAEQRAPIHRVVALKVIKLGMDTASVLERFDAERNALEILDHPNVARVLDAGTTAAGRPYFVVELVDGAPITAYADARRLSVRERLKLMIQACDAVQHAHQKAIIHRDIKPSNILVAERDGIPIVKVIDFGVAKALQKMTTDKAFFTEVGQMVGTPEYMSPEQADGERDIDTRTDVYSLGVVLYELLSGALPFDPKALRSAGYGEVLRIIRTVDPPKPSARLSSLGEASVVVADHRQVSAAALVQQLRSELDWIVIKSLGKDRESRYATPTELAQDLENYLANRPLRAGPESIIYRTRKFVRRNKAAVSTIAIALGLLFAGIAATTWQAIRATRAEHAIRQEQDRTLAEKQNAVAARATAEEANAATAQVNEFLVEMLRSASPEIAQGKEVLVRDVIDRAAVDVGTKFTAQPKIEAAIRSALGHTYNGLGLHTKAEEHLLAAFELQKQITGDASRETLRSKLDLAELHSATGKLDDAFERITQVLDDATRLFGESDPLTMDAEHELGFISDLRGDYATAERLYRKSLAAAERAGTTNTAQYYITLGNVGQMMRPLGRPAEGEPLAKAALDGMIRLRGENDPVAIDMLGTYADLLRLQRKFPEAEAAMREYLQRAEAVYGPDHKNAIVAEQGLAIVLASSGRYDEAMPLFQNALARMRRVMGSEHPETLNQMTSLASMLWNSKAYEESRGLFKEAYDGWVKIAGDDHPNAVISLYGFVQSHYSTKQWAEALEPARHLYELVLDPTKVQIPGWRRARYLSAYGIVLSQLGRHDEAAQPLMIAYDALSKEDKSMTGLPAAYASVLRALELGAEAKGDAVSAQRWRDELAAFDAPSATMPAR